MIIFIKVAHTFIWAVMASAIFYTLYAGITNTFNPFVLSSIALIVFETLILLLNKWSCPLTPLAKRYTSDRSSNFDIYLPEWLAKHNKTIFSAIFIIGLVLVIINLIQK